MKIAYDKYNIKGSGSGNGKMSFDTVNKFSTKYDLDNEMIFDLKQKYYFLSNSNFYKKVFLIKLFYILAKHKHSKRMISFNTYYFTNFYYFFFGKRSELVLCYVR